MATPRMPTTTVIYKKNKDLSTTEELMALSGKEELVS